MSSYSRTEFCDVDVCIVMESTYPYLKGGVSAVVHDIITFNPDLTFGIIHTMWDTESPQEDLYDVPENVKWIKVLYLSFDHHRPEITRLGANDLPPGGRARRDLANRLLDALAAVQRDDVEPLWQIYDEGVNPRTRQYRLWPLLGTSEFMAAVVDRWEALGMTLSECFWVLRDFFSLAYAILEHDFPRARVYHAHTTGYASVIGAAAARQNGTHFLLTEHNLYIRDTVNELIDRNMALPLHRDDYRSFDVTPQERAWMTWWTEMGVFCYPSAELITYLYPLAVDESRDLGSPSDRAIVLPNGMPSAEFEPRYRIRQEKTAEIVAHGKETWRFCSIVRIVPIKGVMDLIEAARLMVASGFTNFTIDVLGPKEHVPAYTQQCEDRIVELGLQEHVRLLGTANVRKVITEYDLLLMASYNEGQPIVVLEAMATGIPTVGTEVGGMRQVLDDVFYDRDGQELAACGVLIDAGDYQAMARETIALVNDLERYDRYAKLAHRRVDAKFRIEDIMKRYNSVYRAVGRLDDPNGIVDPSVHAGTQSRAEADADMWIASTDGAPALSPDQVTLPAHAAFGVAESSAQLHEGADVEPSTPSDDAELPRYAIEAGVGHGRPQYLRTNRSASPRRQVEPVDL